MVHSIWGAITLAVMFIAAFAWLAWTCARKKDMLGMWAAIFWISFTPLAVYKPVPMQWAPVQFIVFVFTLAAWLTVRAAVRTLRATGPRR